MSVFFKVIVFFLCLFLITGFVQSALILTTPVYLLLSLNLKYIEVMSLWVKMTIVPPKIYSVIVINVIDRWLSIWMSYDRPVFAVVKIIFL